MTNWVKSDVHQWSKEMSTCILKLYPALPDETRLCAQQFDRVYKEINGTLKNIKVLDTLNFMKSRANGIDRDLCCILASGLLVVCWDMAKEMNDKDSIAPLFIDTLDDMGKTCIQGHTHRLFSLYVALKESQKSIKGSRE